MQDLLFCLLTKVMKFCVLKLEAVGFFNKFKFITLLYREWNDFYIFDALNKKFNTINYGFNKIDIRN